jgi:hypothetical protein
MNNSHHHRIRHALIATLAGALAVPALWAIVPLTAQAAVACNEAALVAAVNAANTAGGGSVVLTPGCTYTLTRSHANAGHGPDGLPVIKTVISFSGSNNVIARSLAPATPSFRIAEVSSKGNFTLNGVTLTNGLAVGSGGGILNNGSVTMTGSGLTNNRASGTGGGLSNTGVASPATGTTATFTSSTVGGNTATGRGGGVYNGLRGTLTTTSSFVTTNTSGNRGGGIAAINSTATTLTSTPVNANVALLGAGGVYRLSGVMTITTSPITGNVPNNCVGSSPAVPSCTA